MKCPNTNMSPKKKPARLDTNVKKAHVALFYGDHTISGKCTFVGKKYKDGWIIFEITMIKQI